MMFTIPQGADLRWRSVRLPRETSKGLLPGRNRTLEFQYAGRRYQVLDPANQTQFWDVESGEIVEIDMSEYLG